MQYTAFGLAVIIVLSLIAMPLAAGISTGEEIERLERLQAAEDGDHTTGTTALVGASGGTPVATVQDDHEQDPNDGNDRTNRNDRNDDDDRLSVGARFSSFTSIMDRQIGAGIERLSFQFELTVISDTQAERAARLAAYEPDFGDREDDLQLFQSNLNQAHEDGAIDDREFRTEQAKITIDAMAMADMAAFALDEIDGISPSVLEEHGLDSESFKQYCDIAEQLADGDIQALIDPYWDKLTEDLIYGYLEEEFGGLGVKTLEEFEAELLAALEAYIEQPFDEFDLMEAIEDPFTDIEDLFVDPFQELLDGLPDEIVVDVTDLGSGVDFDYDLIDQDLDLPALRDDGALQAYLEGLEAMAADVGQLVEDIEAFADGLQELAADGIPSSLEEAQLLNEAEHMAAECLNELDVIATETLAAVADHAEEVIDAVQDLAGDTIDEFTDLPVEDLGMVGGLDADVVVELSELDMRFIEAIEAMEMEVLGVLQDIETDFALQIYEEIGDLSSSLIVTIPDLPPDQLEALNLSTDVFDALNETYQVEDIAAMVELDLDIIETVSGVLPDAASAVKNFDMDLIVTIQGLDAPALDAVVELDAPVLLDVQAMDMDFGAMDFDFSFPEPPSIGMPSVSVPDIPMPPLDFDMPDLDMPDLDDLDIDIDIPDPDDLGLPDPGDMAPEMPELDLIDQLPDDLAVSLPDGCLGEVDLDDILDADAIMDMIPDEPPEFPVDIPEDPLSGLVPPVLDDGEVLDRILDALDDPLDQLPDDILDEIKPDFIDDIEALIDAMPDSCDVVVAQIEAYLEEELPGNNYDIEAVLHLFDEDFAGIFGELCPDLFHGPPDELFIDVSPCG